MKQTKNFILGLSVAMFVAACGRNGNNYDASGVFEATEVIVSSEAQGKILQFNIEEGRELKAGDLIGYIDSVQLYLRKMQLMASVKAVQSRRPDVNTQIAALSEQIKRTEKEKRRIENLIEAKAANRKQLDDITTQIAVLEKQLDAQRSTLNSTNRGITEESSALEIQVAQIDDQLRKCRIVNPVDGTVLAKYAEQHEVTGPGKALYKIADIKNMILRAYITSGQLTQLKLGQMVKVLADFGDKGVKEYEGTVSWIASKSEFTPKTIQTRDERANLVYAIKVSVPNDGYLKIGMYASIETETK